MAIPVTNMMMLGRLGANVFFRFMIYGMGLVMAASPMIARELGARRHNLRAVRSIVKQAVWATFSFSVLVVLVL